MTTFVLVHGAYRGGWCWHTVVSELEGRGHEVVAPDLPAHGVDTTPATEVAFEDYVDRVCTAIDARDGPVVLVGHSMAGMVVTGVAERRPDAVETLVYLTAYLPGSGDAMLDHRVGGSLIARTFVVDEARGVGYIPADALEELFYADCSPADVALAESLVRPEPLDPLGEPVTATDDNYGRVRRVYVRCSEDRAITPEKQDAMLKARGADAVLTIEASHSPFLSLPEATADRLAAAASG